MKILNQFVNVHALFNFLSFVGCYIQVKRFVFSFYTLHTKFRNNSYVPIIVIISKNFVSRETKYF